jgi:hypothetical protein
MDRITSSTKSGVFVEAMCRIDVYENNRISLYKGFQTANRVSISYDFSTNLISITAILPIDSVDTSKPQGSINHIVFPSLNIVRVSGAILASIDPNNTGGESVVSVESVAYTSASSLFLVDSARSEPRKNIQVTLDPPNLKAIIDATIPFRSYLNNLGAVETIPLDD